MPFFFSFFFFSVSTEVCREVFKTQHPALYYGRNFPAKAAFSTTCLETVIYCSAAATAAVFDRDMEQVHSEMRD